MPNNEFLNADRWQHTCIRDSKTELITIRRNGKTQTWKRKPEAFRIPVKHGLKTCFYLTHLNAHEWVAL